MWGKTAMDIKYQVFISSTYEDLQEERQKVQEAILSMYQFPIGMEMFSADDSEQWEIIRETIDTSDFYILIIEHRYGSIIKEGKDAGMSYTEKEFRWLGMRWWKIVRVFWNSGNSKCRERISWPDTGRRSSWSIRKMRSH